MSVSRSETNVSTMHVRSRRLSPAVAHSEEWTEPTKAPKSEAFLKNLGVASALVLCAVTLRTGAIPQLDSAADAVLTAATDQSLLDDQLGKLSFVSALFPEAVLVFGEHTADDLNMPVSGGAVVHVWSEAEPYMSWRTSSVQVTASADGEVIGVYHGHGDERLVQIMGNDGLACIYGNMDRVDVRAGDAVSAGDVIGTLIPGEDFVFEVRKDGLSIDPGLFFSR